MDQLKEMVLKEMADEPVRVLLFGSRAKGTHRSGSDVDIAFVPKTRMSWSRISFLREKIEASCIPYKVDIVDLSEASEEFCTQALKDAVIWKNWN